MHTTWSQWLSAQPKQTASIGVGQPKVLNCGRSKDKERKNPAGPVTTMSLVPNGPMVPKTKTEYGTLVLS